jgi:predicted glycosyltransferase
MGIPLKNANKTVVISCSGLGMGNASRMAAVMEALNGQVRCHVVTWGSSYRFFKKLQEQGQLDFELCQIRDYGNRFNLLRYLIVFITNSYILYGLLRRIRPDVLLLDSDYHFPAYLSRRRSVIFLGQTLDVLERARAVRFRGANWREHLSFLFRERLDWWYQRLISTWVLVPEFGTSTPTYGKARRIPLVVRNEFLAPLHKPTRARTGILLSGSDIEKEAFMQIAERHHLKVLNDLPSKAANLDQLDILVIQGGLSSISECIAREKFMVVVPIADHPEQYLNALQVEQLGLGLRSTLYELSQFPHLMDRVQRHRHQTPKASVDCTGAAIAADFILYDVLKIKRPAPQRQLNQLVQSFFEETVPS